MIQLFLHDKMDVDNDILYEVFSSILLSAGFNTIPSKDKVKAFGKQTLERERKRVVYTNIKNKNLHKTLLMQIKYLIECENDIGKQRFI